MIENRKIFPDPKQGLIENINRNKVKVYNLRMTTTPKDTYWKNTLKVTLLPFVLWGIPIHKLFSKRKTLDTNDWLSVVGSHSNFCSILLTILLFGVAISINGYVLYSFGDLFYELVIKADPSPTISQDINVIFQVGPAIIPINYVWLFGFNICNLIESFDRKLFTIARSYHVELPVFVSTRPFGRSTLFIIYFVIVILFLFKFVLLFYRDQSQDTITEVTFQYIFKDFLTNSILYTFTFPVYASLCGAIRYQFQILFSYINILMEDGESVQMKYLDDFKRAYKVIADQILQINSHCSLYLSWVFSVIAFSLYEEAKEVAIKAIEIIFSDDNTFRPFQIRVLLGDVFVILLYAGLGVFTVWQAVQANDDARYLHVWLNDFVTTPTSELSTETYQAFRMLKYYVHSRMEQPKPALLSITFLSFIPFMRTRLLGYNVYH